MVTTAIKILMKDMWGLLKTPNKELDFIQIFLLQSDTILME